MAVINAEGLQKKINKKTNETGKIFPVRPKNSNFNLKDDSC